MFSFCRTDPQVGQRQEEDIPRSSQVNQPNSVNDSHSLCYTPNSGNTQIPAIAVWPPLHSSLCQSSAVLLLRTCCSSSTPIIFNCQTQKKRGPWRSHINYHGSRTDHYEPHRPPGAPRSGLRRGLGRLDIVVLLGWARHW